MMSTMTKRIFASTTLMLTAFSPLVMGAHAAQAFPKGDSIIGFDYKIDATTVIKKSNQTMTVKGGKFHGEVDFDRGEIAGSIKLPDAKSTVGAGPAAVQIVARTIPTAPVSGKINLDTFKVTSTSHFLLKIVSMTPVVPGGLPLPKINLVGNSCQTVAPINVTMSGIAHLGAPSTFRGTFSIPNLANCQGMENVLNQLIPGPGNTFIATARP
jgi:hypothetical protein